MSAVLEAPAIVRRPTTVVRPIPMTRIVAVELRKMFDTRSGFWLVASIVIAAVVATGFVVWLTPGADLYYSTFATAIGVPMAVILPMIAILSVTSEYTQRTGLTSFTLVPHRQLVILAKAIAALIIAVGSVLIAFAVGAVGNLVGPAIAGVDPVWDVSIVEALHITLASSLGMLIGFMLGVLIRNSPGAIVGYFLYSGVLPTLFGMLAFAQEWFRDLQPWVDFGFAQQALYDAPLTSEQWSHLGVAALVWLVVPLAVGTRIALRAEVK